MDDQKKESRTKKEQRFIKEIVRQLKNDDYFTERVSREVQKAVLRHSFLHDLSNVTLKKMNSDIKYIAGEESRKYLAKIDVTQHINELDQLKKKFAELLEELDKIRLRNE